MNPETLPPLLDVPAQPAKKSGCGSLILYIILLLWVSLISLAASLVNWTIEQGNFSGEITLPNIRWAVILVGGLVILVPCLVAALILKASSWRSAIRSWMLAGLFLLLMAPSFLTFISDFQWTLLIKIVAIAVYLVVILIWRKIAKLPKLTFTRSGLWLALLCGALLAIPWLFGGSLGSLTDTILVFVLSILFGLAASLTLDFNLSSIPDSSAANHNQVWFNGLTTFIMLFVMVAGLAESGNQYELLLSVPLIGLSLAALTVYAAEAQPSNQFLPLTILTALSLFWPLALVDPDELMAVITSGKGDLMPLVTRLSFISMILVLVMGIVLLMTQKWLRRASGKALAHWLPVLLIWVAIALLYYMNGLAGFYGEQLFVILKNQPDMAAAEQIKDYSQRRAYVYSNLVAQANQSQAGLRASLDQFGIHYTPYYLVNALEVDGGPFVQLWLSTRPEVDRILASPHLRPLPAALPVNKGDLTLADQNLWNLKMIRTDQVQNQLKVSGKGIVVGQSDSGVDYQHPELASAYRGLAQGDDYNWLDPWYHTPKPVDLDGHGTHTLGTILGKNVGIAPDAQWIGCANLARNLGNPGLYLDCMQFMLAPFPQKGNPFKDGDPARGAMVLNNSWGCPDVEGCDANVMLPAVKALRHAGVFVVASAGNGGASGCATIKDPIALYQQVYSVGAVDKDGNIADFSSLGPVTVDGSNRVKPDIVAPGVDVFSSTPQNTYAIYSGTSMAGPHLVGVVALMWSANPKLIGDIDKTTQILDSTTQKYTGPLPACIKDSADTPNDAVGYGIVDAYAAVKAAQEVK